MKHEVDRRAGIWTKPFAITWVASFAVNLAYHTFVHFPGQLRTFAAGETYIGAVVATMSLVALLVRPSIGRAMDGIGRRRVAIVGAALNVVACALYVTIRDAGPWVFVVRTLHGVAEGALFSVLFTIAADLVPAEKRTEGIAIFGVSGMVNVSLGAELGDYVLRAAGYDELWLICAALAAVGLGCLLVVPETRPAHDQPSAKFVDVALQRTLLPMWLIGIVFAIALSSYFTFLKTFALEHGDFDLGVFFTPYAGIAIALRLGFGWIPDRFGPKRTLFPAIAIIAVGLVVLASSGGSPPWVAAAGLLCGIGHGYSFPIINALVVTRAPAHARGSAVTLFTAVFDVGTLLGGPAFGLWADRFGHEAMFVAASVVAVVGMAAFAVADRPLARAQAPR